MGFVAQRGFVLSVTHPGCLEGRGFSSRFTIGAAQVLVVSGSVVMEQPSGSIWVPLGEPGLWFCGFKELFPSSSLCFWPVWRCHEALGWLVGSHLLSFPAELLASGFGNIPNLSLCSLLGCFRAKWFSSEGEEWVLPAQSEV